MKLVIAEKPSVGAAIAAVMGANEKRSGYFEGGGYLVSWCIGHLISLADAATYNEQFRKWKYDDLPLSRRSGGLSLPAARSSSFLFSKTLCTAATLPRLSMRATAGARENSFSVLSMTRRIAKSPFPAFGLAAWKKAQSARAFQTSKTGAAMTTSINPRFAEQRPIGSLALTRPAFSLSSTIKH